MTMRGSAGTRTAVALVLLAVLAAGCSSSEGTASSDPAPTDSSSTTAATASDAVAPGPPVTTQPRQSCSVATLAPASGTPDAALVDVVCETDHAAATLTNGPDGETIVVFSLTNGVWTLVGSAPAAGDTAAAAPAGVSATIIPTWSRARDARIARAAAPPSAGGDLPTVDDPKRGCRAEGDVYICPDITEPSLPPDPENPDAPPVTSNFCRYNFNDTRCVESGQTFQPRSNGE